MYSKNFNINLNILSVRFDSDFKVIDIIRFSEEIKQYNNITIKMDLSNLKTYQNYCAILEIIQEFIIKNIKIENNYNHNDYKLIIYVTEEIYSVILKKCKKEIMLYLQLIK
ncbi:hypothetical protein [Clostridium sp.]|uniref:hypothetical protein n=1 Tax=Clostridium sp. TaxID=1506 RepID=UPI002607ECEE|nr:hypothetical protein [Clostridium sp.]